jgi:GNAT superfamily N-acetyltransferase
VADARATALAFMRDTLAASADVREEHRWGALLRTPSLDAVWALNQVFVERPAPDLTLADVEALLRERFAGGRFASAMLEDEATGARIEAEARERGWRVEHELVMALRREPDRRADTSGVREGEMAELRALADRWFAEDFADQGEETLRQLAEFSAREWEARPTRGFVAAGGQAMCKLWSDGSVAQVEDVYTAPQARGGGHARALVTHATDVARESGHELIFIVADDDDTPKHLYERLGYDPLVRVTRVSRELRPPA